VSPQVEADQHLEPVAPGGLLRQEAAFVEAERQRLLDFK
jgi:hypothetical protein